MRSPSTYATALVKIAAVAAGLLNVAIAQAGEASGEKIFADQCARCHGASGEGTKANYPDPLVGDHSIAQLAAVIAKSMPEDADEKCPPEDARKVAEYIYSAFYSPEAQFRNKPARVELSRLTIRQYQNAVTDIIGSFRRSGEWGDERGLVGRYFAGRDFRPPAQKIYRTDPEVHFDFGDGSPDGDKFDPNEFSIAWEGSVLAPDTGDYQFIVRTEHAARLWVNGDENPLIDAWVKSGDDIEYRADIRLLGGRAYPLKLEFSKAKQGVNDGKKRKRKPKPKIKASISLEWKRPFHTEEVIPSRNLSVKESPGVFVLHAPFPPDDRSTGYERGTSISKAWDDATTEAAIEVASYVMDHLNELADTRDDASDRDANLRAFCNTFAERAFRGPLTDEQEHLYVAHQFEKQSADSEAAVKRVLLLVLKSPRFLYREVGASDSASSFDVAARMSFGLWDSVPDEVLRAAASNQSMSATQIADQLQRMIADPRTHAKLREFLLTWLKVSQPRDVSKDPKTYPEFTPDMISDLRTSLELTVDDVLDTETADYRQFILCDSMFMNGRLAAIYGVNLPKDAPFEKVKFQPEHRAGLLSHPYLLANFAYTNSSSPIHRGVFISRNLLGRALKQPPKAVAPLPIDLHADLTTRERVALQTKPQACQSCHSVINPLGFSLEEFDAIGRYREREKDRPIDAAGSYVTKSGQIVKFHGVPDLAAFLAKSEESQAAFVRQLFQFLVKQPIRAYGPDCWDQLQKSFVKNEFNVHKLAAEIVATSALPNSSPPNER